MIFRRLIFCIPAILALSGISSAQTEFRPVYSTVPYLTITPDSRSGAMGDIGVATSPDINSQNWNAAKYAMIREKSGVTISFTPWLRSLVSDINLAYLAGFYRIDDKQAVSASLKYFSMGEIIATGENPNENWGTINPNEFSVDLGYSRRLSQQLAASLLFKFIRSDINGGRSFPGSPDYNPGYSYAADIGLYYQRPANIGNNDGEFAWGLNISNLGSKISYKSGSDKQFIPANLKLGARYTFQMDEYNSISAAVEVSKLLVPTPPVWADTTNDNIDNRVIVDGKPTPSSLPKSWIQSFYDAPDGFREEMQEIIYSVGLEYWYREQFAIRGGYFHESAEKGNRKFFAVGIGLKLNVFSLDYSYLISTTGRSNPLANTMRFTIGFLFND